MPALFTLISSNNNLSAGHMALAERYIDDYKIDMVRPPRWLSKNKAAQFALSAPFDKRQMDTIRMAMAEDNVDILITYEKAARKKLLIADMDCTIITGETLDEMAETLGLGTEIAEITESAMNGDIDFHEALTKRVEMMAGQPESILASHLPHMHLSEGAQTLVQTMSAHGATCVLVSGGFTFFTSHIATKTGFHHHHGNNIEIEGGALTGAIIPPILDKNAKYEFLQLYINELELHPYETLTIGDGANDIEMLKHADLGIGYRPKQLLQDELLNQIHFCDLTSALYAQGYTEDEFVT